MAVTHSATPEDITVFYWAFSPWASKVTAYLALRRLPHAECDQPITLPRPDLAALGVRYRRIPVVAIGRDIFCDTLCVLGALERYFPPALAPGSVSSSKGAAASNGTGAAARPTNPSLAAPDAAGAALTRLLEKWTDVAVFRHAADAIPSSLPLCQDPAFVKDRTELWGYEWTPEAQDARRPKGLANLRAHFDLLEDLLADGRPWLLGEQGPLLADIHAAWIFGWMRSLPDGLPEGHFPRDRYAQTHAWLDRYEAAVQASKDAGPTPQVVKGEAALRKVLGIDAGGDAFLLPEREVQEGDPLGLRKGEMVEVYATDTGFNHRDRGKLVGLDNAEVVIEKASPSDGRPIRLHFPRWNFSIAASGDAADGKEG